MLHFSAIINWHASERKIEPAFHVNISIFDGNKIGFRFYRFVNHRTELAFPSYENQREEVLLTL